MRIAFSYNHLHAEDFLYYKKASLINEIEDCLKDVDANKYLKFSCDKANLGSILYDQKALNAEIKNRLIAKEWTEFKTSYYVTSDQKTTKEIVKIPDAEEQKRVILENNQEPLKSFNQVDFFKERVAVEVQFGKYFSVAYDLHVKHTFFYIRDDIDVGIEIIPTHRMMLCMDTGVAWYENEVTNVIREGRNNPSVPVYILGIESDDFISTDPQDFTDSELKDILENSDKEKLAGQIKRASVEDKKKWGDQIEKAKNRLDLLQKQIEELDQEYQALIENGADKDCKEIQNLVRRNISLMKKRDEANDKYYEIKANPPARLVRIQKIEKLL